MEKPSNYTELAAAVIKAGKERITAYSANYSSYIVKRRGVKFHGSWNYATNKFDEKRA